MSNSSRRTRSSSGHLNAALEARTSPRRQSRSSASQSSSLPFNYLVKRDPPPAVKPTPVPIEKPDLLPVDNFYLEKDVPDVHKLRENRAARIIAHSDVNLVQQHFNRMRNRPQRLPSNNGMSDDEDSDSDETPHGIQDFNSAAASFPSTPYMFNHPSLHHELNYV